MKVPKNYTTADILAALYLNIWSFCAGWNKVSFHEPQLTYILKKYNIKLQFRRLLDVSAYTVRIENTHFIVFNADMVPAEAHRDQESFIDWVCTDKTQHMRFVFLHEIGHILLHSDVAETCVSDSAQTLFRTHVESINRFNSTGESYEIAALIREVEADIFAIIAMTPDYGIVDEELKHMRKGRSAHYIRRMVEQRVLRELSPSVCGDNIHTDELVSLAKYRVDLFDKTGRAFYAVSSMIEPGDFHLRPRTLEEVTAKRYGWDRNDDPELWGNAVFDMLLEHPLVKKDEVLMERARREGALPFSEFLKKLPKSISC